MVYREIMPTTDFKYPSFDCALPDCSPFSFLPFRKGYSARPLSWEMYRSWTERNIQNWTMGSSVTWAKQL